MAKTISNPITELYGKVKVLGDKSISHRSLIFGSLAKGRTRVCEILKAEDIISTKEALENMGVKIQQEENGDFTIDGVGLTGLKAPEIPLDMGNAGTGARLMLGLLATQNFSSTITGDESLKKRPMGRVLNPIKEMGAIFVDNNNGKLPITVKDSQQLKPITYELEVASAQVKSAILLAGLNIKGKTTIIEPIPTRDHTEKMLKAFGADINVKTDDENRRIITINGKKELSSQDIVVPSDFSSAAFLIVAGLISKKSELLIKEVGINPLRSGLLKPLEMMGANIVLENKKEIAGEEIADIRVKSSKLNSIDLSGEIAPKMIDEYPILAVASSFAKGTTRLRGLGELRVKESNRLEGTAQMLNLCGVKTKIDVDDLIIYGKNDDKPRGGVVIPTNLDHRMAMSALVMGTSSMEPISIDDNSPILTSFPNFIELMNSCGADIR